MIQSNWIEVCEILRVFEKLKLIRSFSFVLMHASWRIRVRKSTADQLVGSLFTGHRQLTCWTRRASAHTRCRCKARVWRRERGRARCLRRSWCGSWCQRPLGSCSWPLGTWAPLTCCPWRGSWTWAASKQQVRPSHALSYQSGNDLQSRRCAESLQWLASSLRILLPLVVETCCLQLTELELWQEI